MQDLLTIPLLIIKRNATLIYSEVIIPGRRYHHKNELNGFDYYSSTVSAKDESGNILFKEQIVKLSPKEHPMTEIGIIGSFQIIGTIFILTPVEKYCIYSVDLQSSLRQRLLLWDVNTPYGIGSYIQRY